MKTIPKALARRPARNPIYVDAITRGDFALVWAAYTISRFERLFRRPMTGGEVRSAWARFGLVWPQPVEDDALPRTEARYALVLEP